MPACDGRLWPVGPDGYGALCPRRDRPAHRGRLVEHAEEQHCKSLEIGGLERCFWPFPAESGVTYGGKTRQKATKNVAFARCRVASAAKPGGSDRERRFTSRTANHGAAMTALDRNEFQKFKGWGCKKCSRQDAKSPRDRRMSESKGGFA